MKQQELIEKLQNRYAVKKFDIDKSKKLEGVEDVVKDILGLTPTSFGLQAQKFLMIKDRDVREKLREYSWGQQTITDGYMIIVFCIPSKFDRSNIEKATQLTQDIRGNLDQEKIEKRNNFIADTVLNRGEEIGIIDIDEWLSKQLYIALGNLLTSLAILGIDSCPIEGFNSKKYDEVLHLSEKNLKSKIVLALGVKSQDDMYQFEKKVRFSHDELFEDIGNEV